MCFTKIFLIEYKTNNTRNTPSIIISLTIRNIAYFWWSQLIGILTLSTTIFNHIKTSSDATSSIIEWKWRLASYAIILIIIVASWGSFNAFMLLLTVIIAAHAFYTSSIFIHFITILIFRNTHSIWSKNIVRITLKTFSKFWN